jgi:hypothetical protein
MKGKIKIAFVLFVLLAGSIALSAQENKLQIKGWICNLKRKYREQNSMAIYG